MNLKNMLFSSIIISGVACNREENTNTDSAVENTRIEFKNHSKTPALIKTMPEFSSIQTYSLFSSEDPFINSPDFVFGGSADGSGLIKNPDGTFTFLVNNEDNFSVSKITFDKTFKPIAGEYVLNSKGAGTRLCSATLAMPEIHGFGPFFLTCGESDSESLVHKIAPTDTHINASIPKTIPAFGRWSAENAVPLSKNAYAGQTIIMIGDDDNKDYGGQLVMYKSTTGDLNNGKVYVIKRIDNESIETKMTENNTYDIEFVEITNAKTNTGLQNNQAAQAANAIVFGRVEDIDWNKTTGKEREIYFNVTGQNNTGVNANNTRTKYGRLYRLELDPSNPLKGKLTVMLDGDNKSGLAKTFQNIDNICVTKNYVYLQEDANGYGDESHDAYIYQYDIAKKTLKVVFELDHRRNDTSDKYLGAKSPKGSWEYGALLDVSDIIEKDNTFMLSIQPHSWEKEDFKGKDGGGLRPDEKQGSQVILINGLPR
ncbi:hypothetical protein B0A78_09445 [Flavobacterium columnare NBRC 100251 = ATCC 23463]|uniref:hypothetical protein n=1 Tax=Flavobacterium columnare TaxID=996 RepID=UPI000BE7BD20|nr:hypothetical protein [Flavobacterium columnare]PDS23380.1 hypothetical protein B0A78_09445 [Flavobacterium columnare NBRC 100251 = ATCC 23463]GEM59007.1 hypothetical protein FC1_22450 [Flavobacterium columnare NBRC 100251 = ATCC 23463]